MSSVLPVPITVTIAETDTVLPDGDTFASLQVVVSDPAGGPDQTGTAALTTPGTYVASFSAVAPAGSITISALNTVGGVEGTALTLPYNTVLSPQTYPQATGITVTSP